MLIIIPLFLVAFSAYALIAIAVSTIRCPRGSWGAHYLFSLPLIQSSIRAGCERYRTNLIESRLSRGRKRADILVVGR